MHGMTNSVHVMRPLLVIGLLWTLQVACAKDCFVLAPNMLRLGSKETLSISVDGQTQVVEISMEDYPGRKRAFFRTTQTVSPDKPMIVEVQVKEDDIPNWEMEPGSYGYVTLKVVCAGSSINEARLLVSPFSADHVFLQTDRPIYRPGSTVHFRLISLDEKLMPSDKELKLQVRNPQGIITEEKKVFPSKKPIFSNDIQIPDPTMTGEWALVVSYGRKDRMNVTTTFKVEKYVLPRFSVEIHPADEYILKDFASVRGHVEARFVNKKPVQGLASFQFGIMNDLGEITWAGSSRHKHLSDGRAPFSVSQQDLRNNLTALLWNNVFLRKSRLVIEATVIEDATGSREKSVHDKTFFSTSPYIVSLAKTQRSFKPGINTYVLAEVTYLNGNPAQNINVRLSANRAIEGSSSIYQTDDKGLASFAISTATNDPMLRVTVTTASHQLQNHEQANSSMVIQPYRTPQRGFIGIGRNDPKKSLKVNEIYEAVLFTNPADKVQRVHFAVISKGRVRHVDRLREGSFVERNLKLKITEDMTPSFRVVAFGRTTDGEVLSDSIYVRTEPACSSASHIKVSRKAGDGVRAEPGSTQTIVVTSTAGTVVGLMGVDKAVYLLNRKDLLTREKLFQTLDSRDLGCGAGGGVDTYEALSGSGVVLLTNSLYNAVRRDSSCREGHRRRREAVLNASAEYDNEHLRGCCELGFQKDRFGRTCDERIAVLQQLIREENDNETECYHAFGRCCYLREDEESSQHMIAKSSFEDLDELIDGGIFNDVETQEWRADFRETWFFDTLTVGQSGTLEYTQTLPSSITTWEVGAVSVAPTGGICVVPPLEVTAFKQIFLEVNLPYSVVQNEQVEIPVTLYNYGSQTVYAKVFLRGTRGICSGAREGESSEPQSLQVPVGHGRTAVFPIVPLETGERLIEAVAFTTQGRDSVRLRLRVEPPGVQKTSSLVVLLDPTNVDQRRNRRQVDIKPDGTSYTDVIVTDQNQQLVTIWRPQPIGLVKGTERCEIGIVADKIGPALQKAIENPEGLVRMLPNGCGEQTMLYLAPTLYVYSHMKAVQSLTEALENKALEHIRYGYKRMLTFRKEDGSFAVWTTTPSILWLTAFVIRNLCEAQKWIMIDPPVLSSGLDYLLSKQKTGGIFEEHYNVIHKELLGGITGPVPMTAYVMLTLEECIREGVKMARDPLVARARALNYIEANLQSSSPAYTLALGSYALSLNKSPKKDLALQWLKDKAVHREGDNTRHIPAGVPHLTVEATAYAVMAFINEQERTEYITSFVNWMHKQMKPTGSFESTQDTVVALQALTRYADYVKEQNIDLTCEVTMNSRKDFKETVRIRRENRRLLNKILIEQPGDMIFVKVNGSGTASLFFDYNYNKATNPDELCKFDLEVSFKEESLLVAGGRVVRSAPQANPRRNAREPRMHKMKVCARAFGRNATGMAIIDVGLLSGFEPVTADLEKIVAGGDCDSYELTKRSVIFYMGSIPYDKKVCVQFALKRKYMVGKLQSSYVRVYDYYKPDMFCSQFYAPNSASPLLKLFCEGTQVCTCAEGGCPPEDPFKGFVKDDRGGNYNEQTQRANLREFACDEVDYVWNGTVIRTRTKDGFQNVEFQIDRALKPGRESEDEVEGQTRHLKVRDRCQAFDTNDTATYVVMGKDSELAVKDESGDERFLYMIDSSARILPVYRGRGKQLRRKSNKLTTWLTQEFSDSGNRCYY